MLPAGCEREAAPRRYPADNDGPDVTVQFGAASYTATEGGAAVTVAVTLSADPERDVTVPLTVTAGGTAMADDYTLSEMSVTINAGEMSATFTVLADEDMVDDDGESITIGFGTLPSGVTATSPETTTVSLADNDDPAVTVQFGAASYTATEGGTDRDRRGHVVGGSRAHRDRASDGHSRGHGDSRRLHAVPNVGDLQLRRDVRHLHGDGGGRQ